MKEIAYCFGDTLKVLRCKFLATPEYYRRPSSAVALQCHLLAAPPETKVSVTMYSRVAFESGPPLDDFKVLLLVIAEPVFIPLGLFAFGAASSLVFCLMLFWLLSSFNRL